MMQTGQMTIGIKQETDRNHGHIENTGTLRLTKYSEPITNEKTPKRGQNSKHWHDSTTLPFPSFQS